MYYWQTWGGCNIVHWGWTPLYFQKWNCYSGSTVLLLKAKSKCYIFLYSNIKSCGAFYWGLSCEKLTGLEIAVWHSHRRNFYWNSVYKVVQLWIILFAYGNVYKHSCMGHSSFIMGLSRPETNWSWNTEYKWAYTWLRTLLSRDRLPNWN